MMSQKITAERLESLARHSDIVPAWTLSQALAEWPKCLRFTSGDTCLQRPQIRKRCARCVLQDVALRRLPDDVPYSGGHYQSNPTRTLFPVNHRDAHECILRMLCCWCEQNLEHDGGQTIEDGPGKLIHQICDWCNLSRRHIDDPDETKSFHRQADETQKIRMIARNPQEVNIENILTEIIRKLPHLSAGTPDDPVVLRYVLIPIIEDCIVAYQRGDAMPSPDDLGLSAGEAQIIYETIRNEAAGT